MDIRINRVALKLSLLGSLLVLCTIASMTRIVLDKGEQDKISEMTVRAAYFARSCAEAMYPSLDTFTLHFNTQELLKDDAVVYAAALGEDGVILSHSDPKRIGEVDAGPVARRALASKNLLVQQYSDKGIVYFDVAVPLLSGARRIGTARLGFTQSSIAQSLKKTKERIVFIACVTVGLSILGTFLIVSWMMRPLPVLAQAAMEVGKGRLDVQVQWKRKDEIGQLAEAFNKMVAGLRERDMIRNTFGRYVSKEVVDGFMSGKLSLSMGGERKELSILMSDIRDFTEISETMPPELVVKMLNRYFAEMVAVIAAHGGTVDKFIGDAILAVFGWPLPRKDHARLAVAAALAMQQRLAVLNRALALEGFKPLRTGCAISTGIAIAGNIGSPEKVQYTVIGDTVNLASRMEASNKDFGTELLVNQPVYEAAKDFFVFKDLGEAVVRGRREKAHYYTVLGHKQAAPPATPPPKI